MPKGPVPERFHEILRSNTLAFVSTVGPNGGPQVNPVWFLWENDELLLSAVPERQKYQNILRNPQLAAAFLDEETKRYVELRGTVTKIEDDPDNAFVNHLARKYTGEDFKFSEPGEERKILHVTIEGYTFLH